MSSEIKKPIKTLGSKFSSFFKWLAGLSLGSLLFLALVLMIALAIFVRTESFQTKLRDQVVKAAQDSFDISIVYQSADIEIFDIYPKISFQEVTLEHSSSKDPVEIQEVSLSISMFLSLPLFLFDKIYISKAEVSGLSHTLDDRKIYDSWAKRLKPKGGILPVEFQTIINELSFHDFVLSVSLPAGQVARHEINAKLFLEEFSLFLSSEDVTVEGLLTYEFFELGEYRVEDGALFLENTRISNGIANIEKFRLESDDDFLEISGTVQSFEEPFLNLGVKGALKAQKYLPFEGLEGRVEIDYSVQGLWNQAKGKGRISSTNLSYLQKRFDSVKIETQLEYPLLKVQDLKLESGAELVQMSGNAFLNSSSNSRFSIQLRNFSLPSYLQLAQPHLSKWKGLVDGQLDVSGSLFGDSKLNIDTKLNVRGFQVSRPSNGDLIYRNELARLDSKIVLNQYEELILGGVLKTKTGSFDVSLELDQNSLRINWDAKFEEGPLGQLFMFAMMGSGSMKGFYGGRFGEMFLRVQPNFDELWLNDHKLENVSGTLMLKDRLLYGSPLTGTGFQVKGGLYFPEGEGAKTVFSDFDFQFSQQKTATIYSSLRQTRDWKVQPIAEVSGSGILNGWVLLPKGSGNLLASGIHFGEDRTAGRLAKANWEFDDGVLYFEDLYIETSKGGGGVLGSLSVMTDGVVDFQLEGKQARLQDWMLLLGSPIPFQSLVDFEIEYERRTDRFSADLNLIQTTLGSRRLPGSRLRINAIQSDFNANLTIFDGQIAVRASSLSARTAQASFEVRGLKVDQLIRELSENGVDFQLKGKGTCDIRFSEEAIKSAFFYRFVTPFERLDCKTQVNESRINRGNIEIHRLEAFTLDLEKRSERPISLKSERIVLQSGEDELILSGRFSSFSDLNLRLDGSTKLESVSYFIPFLSRSEGAMRIRGQWNASGFSGTASVENGLVLLEDSPLVVRNVEAQFRARNSVVEIGRLSGTIRDGGLSVTGRFELDGLEVKNAFLNLQLDGPLVEAQKGIRFRTSGPLTLRIVERDAKISGQLNVYEGVYRKRINFRSDLLQFFRPGQNEYEFFETKESYLDTWALDIRLSTTEPFTIRNNIADGSVDLNLLIRGTIGRPIVEGRASLLDGRFNYYNQTFDLQSGSIQFTGNEQNIPRYDIRAETEIDEYRVFVVFQGDEETDKILYSSDPPLSEKEILALVQYGSPPTDENQFKDEDATTSAAYTGLTFVTGGLQDTIEGALSSDLGIRRFSLFPTFYEETGRTELQLTVGTDIVRNRLALNYSNFVSATGGHEIELDFRLNRNISLVGSWRDTQEEELGEISGDFGGDIIFRFEFE